MAEPLAREMVRESILFMKVSSQRQAIMFLQIALTTISMQRPPNMAEQKKWNHIKVEEYQRGCSLPGA